MRKTAEERFWEKVDRKGTNECWEWQGGRVYGPGGLHYGRFYEGKTGFRAHRYAYALANQVVILPGTCICHKCDNPLCCNPSHLFAGTVQDNMADKVAKGRHMNAGSHGRKLTWELAEQMRAERDQFTISQLAARYNITPVQVSNVMAYRCWATPNKAKKAA
jgi:hypothetical protein